MNKQLSYLLQHRTKRKKGDTTQIAARLAPLEEQERREVQAQGRGEQTVSQGIATQEYGAIVVDNENVRLSGDMMEGSPASGILGIEPVVIVILAFMLLFIAFVAWQISLMPHE